MTTRSRSQGIDGNKLVDAQQALRELRLLALGNDYANEHDVNRLYSLVDDMLDEVTVMVSPTSEDVLKKLDDAIPPTSEDKP